MKYLWTSEQLRGLSDKFLENLLDTCFKNHTESETCWCNPKKLYEHKETGVTSWVHFKPTKH